MANEYKIPIQSFTAKNIEPKEGMIVLLDDGKGKTITAKITEVEKDFVVAMVGTRT